MPPEHEPSAFTLPGIKEDFPFAGEKVRDRRGILAALSGLADKGFKVRPDTAFDFPPCRLHVGFAEPEELLP